MTEKKRGEPNRGPSAYQPNAVPLDQAGSHPCDGLLASKCHWRSVLQFRNCSCKMFVVVKCTLRPQIYFPAAKTGGSFSVRHLPPPPPPPPPHKFYIYIVFAVEFSSLIWKCQRYLSRQSLNFAAAKVKLRLQLQ